MNTMTWLQDGAAWAWHTSLVVAIPGLILLALGRWRGFSARWRMLFAAALLLRLLLPSVPALPGHPASKLETAIASASTTPTVIATSRVELLGAAVASIEEAATSTIAAAPARRISWQAVVAVIWGIGVLAVASWVIASHWLIRRWVRRDAVAPDRHITQLFQWSCHRMGFQRRIGLAAMPRIATAAVCGWLRPIILVPANLRETHTDDEIRGILLHELAHVKRCDVFWSWLGLAACALHWFNPLAWLALRRFHSDRELDCDRMALDYLTVPQRNSYAPALFKTLQGPTLATSAALVPFFRHKHEIHTRILTIMKPSKSLIARLAALAIIPALTVLTLTTAGAAEETPIKKRDGEVKKEGPRDGEVKKEGAPDGERKKVIRDGEEVPQKKKVIRDGEGEAPVKKVPRDGEVRKEGAGEQSEAAQKRKVLRDGEEAPVKKEKVLRDGEEAPVKKEKVLRDGEETPIKKKLVEGDGGGVRKEKGPRDGEVKKEGPRDGEVKKVGPRDGEEGAQKKKVIRDGEGDAPVKKVRDGEVRKEAPRDGEGVVKKGPRDGEVKKEGPRDGEQKKEGERDGEKKVVRDGDR
jgi:beta-lactamase regulating signal transducer with metallopeptidase domain